VRPQSDENSGVEFPTKSAWAIIQLSCSGMAIADWRSPCHRRWQFSWRYPTTWQDSTCLTGFSIGWTLWLDQQDRGESLSADERREAEGLVNLADFLSVLRLRAERVAL